MVLLVVVTGFVWPAWWRTTQPNPLGATATVVRACPLLAADQVGATLGRPGLTGTEQTQPTQTGAVAHRCLYGVPTGPVEAVLEVTDFPVDTPSVEMVVADITRSGTHQRPASGLGIAAGFADNLGGTANMSLVAVSTTNGVLRASTIVVAQAQHPSAAQLRTLLRIAVGNPTP